MTGTKERCLLTLVPINVLFIWFKLASDSWQQNFVGVDCSLYTNYYQSWWKYTSKINVLAEVSFKAEDILLWFVSRYETESNSIPIFHSWLKHDVYNNLIMMRARIVIVGPLNWKYHCQNFPENIIFVPTLKYKGQTVLFESQPSFPVDGSDCVKNFLS